MSTKETFQFTRSAVIKDRTTNKVVMKFDKTFIKLAAPMCEKLNTQAGKKRYHWYESNESI